MKKKVNLFSNVLSDGFDVAGWQRLRGDIERGIERGTGSAIGRSIPRTTEEDSLLPEALDFVA